jgi:hypothetical protein
MLEPTQLALEPTQLALEPTQLALEPTQEFIDLESADLQSLPSSYLAKHLAADIRVSHVMGEFKYDIDQLILRTTISTLIAMIEDIVDKSEIYQLMGMLRNIIILNEKLLSKNTGLVDDISKMIANTDLTHFNKLMVHKMLHNIKSNKPLNNIHFRETIASIHKIPPISVENRAIIEKTLPYFRTTKQMKKDPPIFKVDQIVGARDSENKWWLSRVLHVHNDPQSKHYWYYIHFEGFNAMNREWINSKTYRVRRFNSKKHFLKRL